MILNDGLAQWLGSGPARAGTEAAMAGLARAYSASPALAALKQGLAGAADSGAGAVLALARTFIADDGAIGTLVSDAVAAAAADPMCRPPLRASRNPLQDGLLLFTHPALTIQLAVMSADALAIKRASGDDRPPIAFTGQRTLFRFLKGGGALLSLWEAPPAETEADRPAQRCRPTGRRRLADGEWIEFDGRHESFVVERAESDLVYAFASTSVEAGPIEREYDWRTLELVAASGTDDASARIQMMLALLRTMGRRDAAPLFAQQASASRFYARWQAMREFLALDAELALPHLRAMAASDPHPEVRAAAAETMAAFFPEALPCPA